MTPATPLRGRPGFFGRWRTMGTIGVRMMFHDRLKLAGTLFGVVFAVVLGNFQVGTFLTLVFKNRMFVENAQVDVWIAPPGTRQFQAGTPLNDAHLNRARGTPGVAWAEPLLLQGAALTLPTGGSEALSPVSLDETTFLYSSLRTNKKEYMTEGEDSANIPVRKFYTAKKVNNSWF